MTKRENLIKALRCEMPEWVPICGHVDNYNQPARDGMDPELNKALGTVNWGDEGTVLFSRYLDLDIMDWYGGAPVRTIRHNVTVEWKREGADTTTVWHTPRGDLRDVIRQCRDDGTSYRLEHLLNGPQDLPAFASIFEDETFEVAPDRVERLARRKALIGDDGIIALPVFSTPLGMLIRAYAGVATTAYLTVDAPDALRDLFAVMEDNYTRFLRLAVQYDGDVIITVDDTSTTTISPAMFETYCMGYTDRIADLAHSAGKLYLHHSCGLIRDLLGLYRQTKMDGIHGFTIPPIGNVSVREGRRRVGPNISLFAGLMQIAGSMDDWPAVQASVREMFAGASPGNGLVLGLFGEPTKNMAETKRLLDECRQYQRCPYSL